MIFDLFSSMDFYWKNFSFFNMKSWVMGVAWILIFICFMKTQNRLSVGFQTLVSVFYTTALTEFHYKLKGFVNLVSSVFVIIFFSNVWGLKAYIFSWTSHMVVMMNLSVLLWLFINISSVCYKWVSYFGHLTPQGAPVVLGPLLVCVELVSKFIRPLTLTLRLSIKITTGHIFVSLLSVAGVTCWHKPSSFIIPVVILIQLYIIFELGVGFIQALVYSLLLGQYSEEHTT